MRNFALGYPCPIDFQLTKRYLRPPLTGLRKQWCGEVVELIEKMWAQDPQDRPDISEVVDELHEIIRIHR